MAVSQTLVGETERPFCFDFLTSKILSRTKMYFLAYIQYTIIVLGMSNIVYFMYMKKSDIIKTVKNNLIRLRKHKGLSQKQLAKRMKVTQRVIAYYENEANNIPLIKLQDLADVLEVSIAELLSTKVEKDAIVTIDIRLIRKLKEIEKLPRRSKDALWHTINASLEMHAMKAKK